MPKPLRRDVWNGSDPGAKPQGAVVQDVGNERPGSTTRMIARCLAQAASISWRSRSSSPEPKDRTGLQGMYAMETGPWRRMSTCAIAPPPGPSTMTRATRQPWLRLNSPQRQDCRRSPPASWSGASQLSWAREFVPCGCGRCMSLRLPLRTRRPSFTRAGSLPGYSTARVL